MPSFSPNFIYPFDESTDSTFEFPLQSRTFDRPVVLTPITRDFNESQSDSSSNQKSTPKALLLPTADTLLQESCEQLPTPIIDTSSPQFITNIHNKATKGKSKIVRPAMNRTWRAHSVITHLEEDNRLRGGATIMAKLPYARGSDRSSRKTLARKADAAMKGSSDAPSVSSVSSVTRPHLLSVNNSRIRTSSSGQSSSEKGCCPYRVRVRKRNTASEQCGMQDGDLVITAPRCRCTESEKLKSVLSQSTTAVSSKRTLSTAVRCPIIPKRALSIEDAIIQLSKRCNSPPSEVTGSSSASSNQKKLVHRTLSANRITDELRAKLGLNPPLKKSSIVTTKSSNQGIVSCKKLGSYERIMYGNAIGTQTLVGSPHICSIGRSYSDSQLDLRKHKLKCNRCLHQCNLEEGSFTCDTCVEIQRVRNAFVIEIFADRPATDESKPEHMTCYGVCVGAGILPVVVMFVSLFICSVVLFSDSVMSNVCGHFCSVPTDYRSYRSKSSLWGWLDPYN